MTVGFARIGARGYGAAGSAGRYAAHVAAAGEEDEGAGG